MDKAIVKTMLSINKRKAEVKRDDEVTNLDMAAHNDDYAIETMETPLLILQPKYDKFVQSVKKISIGTLKVFDSGEHFLVGHEIHDVLSDFLQSKSKPR